MRIEIPEYKTLNIDTIFADFNGTLAIDGVIPPSVRQRILTLFSTFCHSGLSSILNYP